MPPTWSKENLIKFYKVAKEFLGIETITKTEEIITGEGWQIFWQPKYPCKWKFSTDNLLLMPSSKIGFIDLYKIGKRYWGYDLGWIFWPQWFHFSNIEYKNAKTHFKHLNRFFILTYKNAPVNEKQNKKLFFTKCWLIVFERIIGSLYDVGAEVSHAKKNIGSGNRSKAFVSFLKELLSLDLRRID